MHENEDFGLEDFESALFEESYQTDDDMDSDDPDVTETDDDTHEPDADDETDSDSDESGEDETEDDSDESEGDDAEGDDESDGSTNDDQKFTIKVNKEERQVTLVEMTALAQKGADYDRVKEQNTQLRQSNTDLQSKIDSMAEKQGVLDILGIVAEKSGATLESLAESLYVNFRKGAGASEEVAREELKSAKLEKELNAFKAQQTQQQKQENDAETRAQRDMDEFNREYPDVKLTEELVNKLVPDIQNGMSLSAAYRKYEKAQDSAHIAELERKLAAKKQNDKNKRQSPGSQQDSGGRRTKSDYEEFEKALFG